jgi:uncharacterized protein YdeI (YjbR/CyaY-like superfamily)
MKSIKYYFHKQAIFMEQIYFKTSKEWREWLKINHETADGVWLIFYKKETGKPSIAYNDALDEALCYGWIDSIIKNIDKEKYVRKFTKRNDDSKWSEINKRKVENLIKEKRMTRFGLCKLKAAKLNGKWFEKDKPEFNYESAGDFELALKNNKKAKEFFDLLAPSSQKQYILWISTAKQQVTKEKRIKESILLLEGGQKLGLK